MLYKDIIEVYYLFAKYDGGVESKCCSSWLEHDYYCMMSDNYEKWSPSDVRRLLHLGVMFGCSETFEGVLCNECPDIDEKLWHFNYTNEDTLTDEELMKVWLLIKGQVGYV